VSEVLTAPHALEFPYTRSTGPVLGAFLRGLAERRVLGIRDGQGRVIVPPQEYDPETSASLTVDDLAEVGTEGTVRTWSWNATPRLGQPLDRPFAWVLVQLDGADVPFLHALDVDSPEAVRSGQRVRIRWAEEPRPHIDAIACFEPAE
jgi:uncharacterized protein